MLLKVAFFLIGATSGGAHPSGQTADGRKMVIMGPHTIHGLINSYALPAYPPASVAARKQGVVVLEVIIDESGRIEQVRTLESPDDAIAQETLRCVKSWLFKPQKAVPDGFPLAITGKLMLYFRLSGNKPTVLLPGLTDQSHSHAEGQSRHKQ